MTEPERLEIWQLQATDGARDVPHRVGAGIAVVRRIRCVSAADPIRNQNHDATKTGHPMSLHRHATHYHGNVSHMALARSRLTAQGQISVPAEVRRKLGLGPGSVLEWDEEDGKVVVRRVGRYTSEEMHKALFPNGPPAPRTVEEMDEGIREYMRKKHARR